MSYSSTPYDIIGEVFKLKLNYCTHVITLPTTLKQAFCQTLYNFREMQENLTLKLRGEITCK